MSQCVRGVGSKGKRESKVTGKGSLPHFLLLSLGSSVVPS